MAQLLTTRSNYGLLILITLAENYGQGPLPLSAVASSQNLPLSYLEQLVPDLRRARLLVAERGRGGGYRLARSPDNISVVEILEVLDGPIHIISCQSRHCPSAGFCATCDFWLAVQRRFHRILREVTLADLLAKDRCYLLP
jgi:Rrf2 family cysteine metabolism transcriptional repressor